MCIQERVAGSNWTMAVCGRPVRPGEQHGEFLGELVCDDCDRQYTDLLRAIALADLSRWLQSRAV